LAAIFSMLNAKITQGAESRLISFVEISTACVLTGIGMLLEFKQLSVPSQSDFLWLAVLGLGCTVYPHAKTIELLKHIDVFTANLSFNMEPVYGIIMAYFIFGETEKMNAGFYGGSLLLMMLIVADMIWSRKRA
jgi:drug/metabolite transporter (DMT)-like permease